MMLLLRGAKLAEVEKWNSSTMERIYYMFPWKKLEDIPQEPAEDTIYATLML